MIDSAAVVKVANEAHIIINAATVAFLAVIGAVAYIVGLIKGKKSAAPKAVPAEEAKK